MWKMEGETNLAMRTFFSKWKSFGQEENNLNWFSEFTGIEKQGTTFPVVLHDTVHALHAAASIEELCMALTSAFLTTTGAHAILYLMNSKNNLLWTVDNGQLIEVPTNVGLLGSLASSQQTVYCKNIETDPRYNPTIDRVRCNKMSFFSTKFYNEYC